jgi:hypothetical protein
MVYTIFNMPMHGDLPMTPIKALELVHRYSELQWAIRACQGYIAEALDKCTGQDGLRLERRKAWEVPPYEPTGDFDTTENEKQTHLRQWYSPDMSDYGPSYIDVNHANGEECIHCYAAHCQIQKRKALRRQFGSVKAAMTRTTPKPAILTRIPAE